MTAAICYHRDHCGATAEKPCTARPRRLYTSTRDGRRIPADRRTLRARRAGRKADTLEALKVELRAALDKAIARGLLEQQQ